MVSQAISKIGGVHNGQTKFITYYMEMPIPYRFHTEVEKGYYSRLMCAGADAFRPLWARRRLNLSAIRLRSEKQRPEAEEKPPLAQ